MNATYYTQRASAGLIITEATHVTPDGISYPHTPGVGTSGQIEGWRRVTDLVENRARLLLEVVDAARAV